MKECALSRIDISREELTHGVGFDLYSTDGETCEIYLAFETKIENATNKIQLLHHVKEYGLAIWQHVTSQIQASTKEKQDKENWNDEALYRARLKMSIFLKESKNALLKDQHFVLESLEQLEKYSRGFGDPKFKSSAKKKIILSGFDPFQGMSSNISGATAMFFHQKKIENAELLSAVFPVRYKDFDQGVVEKFFTPWIDKVNAILTISYTPYTALIDIDRFSANVRAGYPDNDEIAIKGKILDDGQNFYQTSLPYKEMIGNDLRKKGQIVFYNQSWETEEDDSAAHKYPGGEQAADGWNWIKKKGALSMINTKGLPKSGSGGSYLSNEIHYRVSKLRVEHRKELPQGHLHIKDVKNKKQFMEDMEIAIKRLIKTL